MVINSLKEDWIVIRERDLIVKVENLIIPISRAFLRIHQQLV